MKKRYARILAATLSAAMVFTSAPVNFTGIDLGVIEAKAATTHASDGAVEGLFAGVTATAAIGAATNSTAVQDAVKAALEAKVAGKDVTIVGVTGPDGNVAAGANSHNFGVDYKYTPENYCGLNSHTYSGPADDVCDTCGVSTTDELKAANMAALSVSIKSSGKTSLIGAPNGGKAYLYEPASYTTPYNYAIGSLMTAETGSTPIYAVVNGATFAIADSAWTALMNAKPGETADVECVAKVDNTSKKYTVDTDDLTSYEKDGFVYIVRTIKVKKCAWDFDKNTVGPKTVIGTYAVAASYSVGDEKVTLSGTGNNDVEVDYCSVDLGSATTDAQRVGAVRLKTKAAYPKSEWETNFATTVNGWTYDSDDHHFYKTVDLALAPKTIKATDIVWPTKLADGVIITSGDKLADVKLETTKSSQYGDFTLVGTTATASAKDTVYGVKFVAKDGYALDANGSAEVTYTAATLGVAPANFTKKNQIQVSVAKKAIKTEDVQVRLTSTQKAIKYGTPYAVLTADVNAQGSTDCSYTVKGIKSTDFIPMGKQTVTYTVKPNDSDEVSIDGKDSVEITVDVDVEKPVAAGTVSSRVALPFKIGEKTNNWIKADLGIKFASDNADRLVTNAGYTSTKKANKIGGTAIGLLATNSVDVNYQWYNKSGAIYGATGEALEIDTTKMLTDEYYCELTIKLPTGASQAVKDAWEEIIPGGVITTAKKTVTVTNMSITAPANLGAQVYGSINASANVTIVPGKDYTLSSVEWFINDDKGVKVCDITEGTSLTGGKATAKIPATLDAGTYTVCAKATATASGKADDVAVKEIGLVVNKKAIKRADILPTQSRDEKTITYGQTVGEVKYTIPKDAEKYGTYEWRNSKNILDVAVGDQNVTLRFIPNGGTLKNFEGSDFDFTNDGYCDLTLAAYVIPKELTVKANDITIEVGEKLPGEATYTVVGLVGDDKAENIGLTATAKIDTAKVDTTKAATYADVITVEVNFKGSINYEPVVNIEKGSVIVKAAAPVVTPTPTPAPVKQATAAAPKAAKAKATVKVGKKYTLKLKYAAGKKATVKKVTWKSSKKSVATVSSKGKVTAKKAGKTTITATITFKDGSKKKVKFTVTVK